MSYKAFIDGEAGTTGLEIKSRLTQMKNIQLLHIEPELRKNPEARIDMFNKADIVFLCLPDEESIAISNLASNNTRIIDASTAHRTNPDWIYGLPELKNTNSIKNSKRVANPGCHATGFILLISPLVECGILEKSELLSFHSLTGYSGGGKSMIERYKYSRDSSDLEIEAPRQYALTQNHKHMPEVTKYTGLDNTPIFTPIVGDFYRGMLVNVPLHTSKIKRNEHLSRCTPEGLMEFYQAYYDKHRCMKVFSDNDQSHLINNGFISANAMANRDDVAITVQGNEDRINLIAVYDNLGKGASGAAIQNMNIMLGLPEYDGLNIK